MGSSNRRPTAPSSVPCLMRAIQRSLARRSPPPSPAALRVPVRPTRARYVCALWRLPLPLPPALPLSSSVPLRTRRAPPDTANCAFDGGPFTTHSLPTPSTTTTTSSRLRAPPVVPSTPVSVQAGWPADGNPTTGTALAAPPGYLRPTPLRAIPPLMPGPPCLHFRPYHRPHPRETVTPRRVTNRGLSTRTWRPNSTRPLHPSTTRPSFQSAAYVPDLQPSRQSPPTRTALLTTGPLADPLGAAELPFRRRKSYDWHCLKEPAPAAPLDYLRPTPFRAIPPSMARAPMPALPLLPLARPRDSETVTPRRVTSRSLSTRTWRSISTCPLHPSTTPNFIPVGSLRSRPSVRSAVPPTRTAPPTTRSPRGPARSAELPFSAASPCHRPTGQPSRHRLLPSFPRLADHPIVDPCKPFPGEAGLATDTPPLLPPV